MTFATSRSSWGVARAAGSGRGSDVSRRRDVGVVRGDHAVRTRGATLMARRVEDSGAWKRTEARSAAEHLANLAGISVSEARQMLQTSNRVQKLERTAAAMRAGELSPGKAHAIADAASVVPEDEARLLDGRAREVALGCAGGVPAHEGEEQARRSAQADPRGAALHPAQGQRGCVESILPGPIEAQAEFKAAHEPILDELFKAARANGKHEPREAYAFDALIEMARRARGNATTEPGEEPKKRPPAKWLGILRLDLEALQRGWIEGDETCEIRGLGPIPVTRRPRAARRRRVEARDHQGCRRRERHAPRPRADRGATSCVVVAVTHLHRRGLQPHPVRRERPPNRVDQNQTHACSKRSTPSAPTTTTSRPTKVGH